MYVLAGFTGPDIVRTFGLWPPGSGGVFHVWQLLTYSFLHGSLLHLAFNMIAIWMFGAALELRWNDLRYLLTLDHGPIEIHEDLLVFRHGTADRWYTRLKVDAKTLHFLFEIGATCNLIPKTLGRALGLLSKILPATPT